MTKAKHSIVGDNGAGIDAEDITTQPALKKQKIEGAEQQEQEQEQEQDEQEDEDILNKEENTYTLYLKNLNDKLHKNLLKQQLYILFSTYGEVIQIIALKSPKMRGQAHVVFSNVVDSNLAMKSLQGDNFFGKNLVIQRAKTQSHIIERLES